jgi:hypothetical protein
MATKAKTEPVRYSQQIADSICARLAEGESLNAICKSQGYPAESAVRAWALEDRDGFSAKYTRARELQAHKLAEEIIDIADTTQLGVKIVHKASGTETSEGDMIEHRRLRVDARKWYLSKVLPKVYGDRTTLAGDPDAPLGGRPLEGVSTEDLQQALAKLGVKI